MNMSVTLPILYSFRRCPYAMRARMAIAMSGLQVTLREVVLRDKPQEMIALSQKGTVPVLQLTDGTVIDESIDVMLWALQHNDPEDWLTPEIGSLDDMRALIAENDDDFKHHLDRYKYATRYEDVDPLAHRQQGEVFLQGLEKRLATSSFLFGEHITLADIAIFPFVRQFRIADEAWFDHAPYPHLQSWLKWLMESELFLSVMRKYAQWKRGEDGVIFP